MFSRPCTSVPLKRPGLLVIAPPPKMPMNFDPAAPAVAALLLKTMGTSCLRPLKSFAPGRPGVVSFLKKPSAN